MSPLPSSKIIKLTGRAVPLEGDDLDTDRIIPARFLRCVTFEGLGDVVCYDERFDQTGQLKAHVLNDSTYQGATLLLVNKNFGCGSSREHAPQALKRYGFQAFIGESFSEIFASNCVSLGLPAVRVSEAAIKLLMDMVKQNPQLEIEIDIQAGRIKAGDKEVSAHLPESDRLSFLSGSWDITDILLSNETLIRDVEQRLPYPDRFA